MIGLPSSTWSQREIRYAGRSRFEESPTTTQMPGSMRRPRMRSGSFWWCRRMTSSCPRFPARNRRRQDPSSVVAEQVARVDLVGDVLQLLDEAVGHDDVAAALELVEVAHDLRAVEPVVRELRLVDDDLDALGLDPLHDALDAARPEVVGAGLHDEPVDADD